MSKKNIVHKMDPENPLVLSRFGHIAGMGDVGPYALKVQIYMAMAGIEFESKFEDGVNLYANSPNSLCPYMRDGDKLIADSSIIIKHLEEKFDDPLNDKRLTKRQLATGKLLQSLMEEDFFQLMIYGRWLDGDYQSYIDLHWSEVPEEVRRGQLDKQYLEFVKGILHGYRLRLDDPLIYRENMRECLDAIDEYLGDEPYLFGDLPSRYDASLYGLLSSLIHFPIPNRQVKIARGYPRIVAYCDRLREEYFSDEPWGQVKES